MHKEKKYVFLPEAHHGICEETEETMVVPRTQNEKDNGEVSVVKGDSPCPCCGYLTIPNGGDALAYICPVCCWEIDLFLTSDEEPSDQNHGLSLREARANYQAYGAVLPRLKKYARTPLSEEIVYCAPKIERVKK